MAIQKKSLISSRTIEKKPATTPDQQVSVGEPKSLSAKALAGRRFTKTAKRTAIAARTTFKK